MTLRAVAFILALLNVCAAGCASEPPPGVSQVMSRPDCKQIDKGARMINYDELAKLRGASLIEMDAPQEVPDPLRLVAISLGKQATPGNHVLVRDVTRDSPSELTITVGLDEPAWDQLREPASTNPCLVLGFDDPRIEMVHIRARDSLLGSIDFRSVQ